MTTLQALPATGRGFFTIGGTLSANAPSYVERKADADLFLHLSEGQFCYVLTSRQMGKSSLMVHTATRLRKAGTRVALLDLTKVGQNLTPEQWYDGLLIRLGQEFDLEDELEDFWSSGDADIRRMGPMQRWMSAIREVILKSIGGNVVIFVDEIDAVRGLPFSTDEFFAGIRELYNARTSDHELNRITFCLLGVARPSDLIRNINTTPFNIGQRIVLTDFTPEEAEPLIHGLGRSSSVGRKLLRRILHWTGGHPYLTQRMCAAIASQPEIKSGAGVDQVCTELFLSSRARETDDNLLFVRERILRSDVDRADLLDLYRRIRAGKNVPDDDANALIDVLRLSGLVSVRENRLVVRNAIYAHVFDQRWIRVHMPDAELRRQRAAFRRGVLTTGGLAALVIVAIAGLVTYIARLQQIDAVHSYSANMVQAQQDFDTGNYRDGIAMLTQWLPPHCDHFYCIFQPSYIEERLDKSEKQGFEWAYLLGRSGGESALTYIGHEDEVHGVAISPDGSLLATAGGSLDSTVRIFDIRNVDSNQGTPRLLHALVLRDSKGSTTLISPDDSPQWSLDHELRNQKIGNGPVNHPLPGVMSVSFSPDGAWLAIATGTWRSPDPGTVYLWDMRSPERVVHILTNHLHAVNAVAFRNNTEFATAGNDNRSEFWRIAPDGSPVHVPSEDFDENSAATYYGMNYAAFSPDGRVFAMIFGDGHLWIKGKIPLVADVSGLMSMAFYDNDHLLVGSRDGQVKCFDVQGDSPVLLWKQDMGQGLVTSLTISKDKQLLITGGSIGTLRVWKFVNDASGIVSLGRPLRGHRKVVAAVAMTLDQNLIVSGSADQDVRFWVRQQRVEDSLSSSSQSLENISYAAQPSFVQFGAAVKALAYKPCRQGDKICNEHPVIAGLGGVKTGKAEDKPTEIYFSNGEATPQPTDHTAPGTALSWSPDGNFVAAALNSGTVLLWNAATHTLSDSVEAKGSNGKSVPIVALAFSPDGYLAGIGNGADPMLFFWKPTDSGKLAPVKVIDLPKSIATLRAMAFSSRPYRRLAVCGSDDKVWIWKIDPVSNLPREDTLQSLDGTDTSYKTSRGSTPPKLQGPCSAVAFSSDSEWIAAGTTLREIRVWQADDDKWDLVDSNNNMPASINAVAFSPDRENSILAAATADSTILLRDFNPHADFSSRRALPTIAVHSGGVLSVAFSPDGRCIASGSNDKTLQITCALKKSQIQDKICRLQDLDRRDSAQWKQTRTENEDWIHFGDQDSSSFCTNPQGKEK